MNCPKCHEPMSPESEGGWWWCPNCLKLPSPLATEQKEAEFGGGK